MKKLSYINSIELVQTTFQQSSREQTMDRLIDRENSSLSGSKKSYSASTSVKSLFNTYKNSKKPSKSGTHNSSPSFTSQSRPTSPICCGFVEL